MTGNRMLFAAAVAAGVFAADAKVQLGVPFADGMVLQRGRETPVWGTADAGEKVSVSFAGQTLATTAGADGKWCVKLAPMKECATGRTLKANEAEVKDVLVGEVWFCSGQSNTEQPICGGNPHFRDAKGTMRARMTQKPLIRFCLQSNYRTSVEPKKIAPKPVEWKTFTPKNLMADRSFSAIGTYFALEIHNATGVPVGIVGAYWGGTRIEPWTPASGLASVPLTEKMATEPLLDDKAYAAASAEAKKAGKKIRRIQDQPRVLWNEMVAPWTPFAFRGMIWYQGCSNAGDGMLYADKMQALYNGWSKEFKNPGMKLYFVQLAPWGSPVIASIQEGQAKFAATEKNAGMAIINDRGNLSDIHPHDKETVGQRLALFALKRDYGFEDVRCDAPTVKSWKIEGDAFVLSFNDAEGWYLYNPDWDVKTGFEVAGADGKFHPAFIRNLVIRDKKSYRSNGVIQGKDLTVYSPEVKEPKKLRYLHSSPWNGTLYSDADLPLGAFHLGY